MTILMNMISVAMCLVTLAAIVPYAQAQNSQEPGITPLGEPKSSKTKALEAGAKILQRNAPVRGFDIYLVGFHPMKAHPELQMEAHHYCHQINQDFAQCVLFDSSSPTANLNGIEYIISEKLFTSLPAEEKKFWHPHNAEILSGQLVAPGIPEAAEKSLMKEKMNSYGKTWHVWNTGHEGHAADYLPFGEAMLAWSFNRDGELIPGMLAQRDKELKIDSTEKRKQRADLELFAKPQSGVDALNGRFGRPVTDIPGVVDKTRVEGASRKRRGD